MTEKRCIKVAEAARLYGQRRGRKKTDAAIRALKLDEP